MKKPAKINNIILQEIYDTKTVHDSEGNGINAFPTSIHYDTGNILYDAVRKKQPEKALEIGMAYGLSTLFICQALQDIGKGNHTAIDPAETTVWKSIGLLNIKRAGLENLLRFYGNPSYEVLPELLKKGERFDFVFIDGSHLFDYTLLDFFYADRLLSTGGYIMFDDLWMPSVRRVLAFILRNRGYRIALGPWENLNTGWRRKLTVMIQNIFQDPLGFYFSPKVRSHYCIVEKISDDNRPWQHFKPF